MLKQDLKKIVDNEFTVPENMSDMKAVKEVVLALQSTDSETRDDLAYTILSKWLLDVKLLSSDELLSLLNLAISDEMLFNGIGENESDSVFGRTFSALLIALLLIRDNKEPFLQEVHVKNVMNQLITYCKEEIDLRGFVDVKGWAHAAAHISDAIDECVRNRYIGEHESLLLWLALKNLIENSRTVFNAEEDERIATAITRMIEFEKVSIKTVCRWFSEVVLTDDHNIVNRSQRVNYKHVIRSVIMRLEEKKYSQEGLTMLNKVERRFNPYYAKI